MELRIKWITFDKTKVNEYKQLYPDASFLILIKDSGYDDFCPVSYHVDFATFVEHNGYLDDHWDTTNDWFEGQRLEVVAFAPMPWDVFVKYGVDDEYWTPFDIIDNE